MVIVVEGIVEVPAVKIMATGDLLDAHLIEVGVITLLDIRLMVEVEDQEGRGPGHTLLLDTVLKGTMHHVVLGETRHESCNCFLKCRTILETKTFV